MGNQLRRCCAALRRLGLLLAATAAVPFAAGPAEAQPRDEPVLVVSREQVLQEAAPAERLNEIEAVMTAGLQRDVDAIKAELAEEEQELTRLRATLPREEFERRVQEFDQQVRRERERTQRRAAALQTAFREAHQTLLEAMVPILVTVSEELGAKLVLDRDRILLAHPSIDVTDRVIELMNARVSVPELPAIEELEVPAPAEAEEPPGAVPELPGAIPEPRE